jgi:hypothetical protein
VSQVRFNCVSVTNVLHADGMSARILLTLIETKHYMAGTPGERCRLRS